MLLNDEERMVEGWRESGDGRDSDEGEVKRGSKRRESGSRPRRNDPNERRESRGRGRENVIKEVRAHESPSGVRESILRLRCVGIITK